MTYIKLWQSHIAEHFEVPSVCVVIEADVSCSNEGGQVTGVTFACFETSVPRDKQDLERKYKVCNDGLLVFSTVITDT